MSSGWAASIIDSDDLQDSASPRAVRRYLAEMRERLDIIEKWEAENRSTEEPGP